MKGFVKNFSSFLICSCLAAFLLSSHTNVPKQINIADSVIPIMEHIENHPPKKYSERHYLEITDALAKKDQKLRVVTYNILFDLFDHQLEEKTHSWEKRLPRVVKSIENMQPDVLCVQEPYPKQLQDLQRRLGNTYECFVGTSRTGELNAIFYKKERLELDLESYSDGTESLSSVSLALPINPKDEALIADIPDFLPPELEPGRQLTLAHFRDKLTGKRFVVINTHLTYYRVNSREDQALFIESLIGKLNALNKTVILAGDFNTVSNRPDIHRFRFLDGNHIRQIFQRVLKNTNEVALLGHVGPLSTFTKDFLNPNSKAFDEIGTPGIVLDHIYVSKEVTVLANATEPSKVDGHFPSDHMPVVADILLP